MRLRAGEGAGFGTTDTFGVNIYLLSSAKYESGTKSTRDVECVLCLGGFWRIMEDGEDSEDDRNTTSVKYVFPEDKIMVSVGLQRCTRTDRSVSMDSSRKS